MPKYIFLLLLLIFSFLFNLVSNIGSIIIAVAITFFLISAISITIITIFIIVIVYLLRKIKHLQSLPKQVPIQFYDCIGLNVQSSNTNNIESPPKDTAYYTTIGSGDNFIDANPTQIDAN